MNKDNLIWIDLEFTSTDLEKAAIVEIATIVTDSQLEIIAEGPNIVIHKDEETIKSMDPWCIDTFEKTGLTQEIREGTTSTKEAEEKTLSFLREHTAPKASPLCGNSVQHDRYLLMKEMPQLEQHLHYRHIDVSTIKELAKRWHPSIVKNMVKKSSHRALSDIRESIEELKYYKKVFLRHES